MGLFRERKRQKELAQREAAGEPLWTSELPTQTRLKLIHALNSVTESGDGYHSWKGEPVETARTRVLRDEGLANLAGEVNAHSDLYKALQVAEVDLVMSLLEALLVEVAAQSDSSYGNYELPQVRLAMFRNEVNEIFRADRIAAEFVGSEIVEFKSREMHVEVVVPTLQLLAAGREWANVENAYHKAIREIDDDPGDAITDAGTALQEALLLCGAEGNSLGPLAKSAAKMGLLAPHDSAFADAVKKMIDWVSADRSETGDAHKIGTENRDDAWFAVHVVGALILRLSQGRPRTRR